MVEIWNYLFDNQNKELNINLYFFQIQKYNV